MDYMQFEKAEYFICNLSDFTLSEALRYWKAKFVFFKDFYREVITHSGLAAFGSFVQECWDSIVPISVTEALLEKNMEKRRVMFDCIGIGKMFAELNPELLDKQVLKKNSIRWNKNNTPYEYEYEDTYELYKIPGEKLFNVWEEPSDVYAVRCWCTTTGREYYIYVPEEVALGNTESKSKEHKPDAVRAIAWTIKIDISHPKKIYRQGDIIVAVESEASQTIEPYHLSKQQYLDLMYSET